MFIRPMGVTVSAANRPAGHPLLRGLLARAAGAAEASQASQAWERTAGAVTPAEPLPGAQPEPWEPAGPDAGPEPGADPGADRGATIRPDTTPPAGPAAPAGPGASAGLVAELTQLAVLAREGLLTPQEFTAAKARLLRG
ncbi:MULTISPECIES: SHOCT domain-containing protein [unclassified Streptomyces]|uniref:SHOCT domain-containing protein n=1 Tax=unclassified Streptomyces TaxID=2593676 RepID=UPI0037F1A84A